MGIYINHRLTLRKTTRCPWTSSRRPETSSWYPETGDFGQAEGRSRGGRDHSIEDILSMWDLHASAYTSQTDGEQSNRLYGDTWQKVIPYRGPSNNAMSKLDKQVSLIRDVRKTKKTNEEKKGATPILNTAVPSCRHRLTGGTIKGERLAWEPSQKKAQKPHTQKKKKKKA